MAGAGLTMFQLAAKPGPVWEELIPAIGDRPAVRVLFAPVSAKALRHARKAVAEILRGDAPDKMDDAGDAFTAALIRAGILDWEGIGNEQDEPIKPTPDYEILDPASGEVVGIEPGTISAFLAEPRLVEAADRKYVLPWTRADAEKNGSAPSPSGTSATAGSDTASLPAKPESEGAAPDASTKPKRPRRTKAKPSGN
jgi:hypothetical protein